MALNFDFLSFAIKLLSGENVILPEINITPSAILYNYNSNAAIFMSCIGMIQEILIESTQTIWFYKPNKFN